VCEALSDRSDLLRQRVFWGVNETAALSAKVTVANEKLSTVVEHLTVMEGQLNQLESLCDESSPCHIVSKESVPVSDPEGHAGIGELKVAAVEIREAAEVGTEVGNRSVWILVGVLVGGLAVTMLWRVFHA
jgi:hypothetical protein